MAYASLLFVCASVSALGRRVLPRPTPFLRPPLQPRFSSAGPVAQVQGARIEHTRASLAGPTAYPELRSVGRYASDTDILGRFLDNELDDYDLPLILGDKKESTTGMMENFEEGADFSKAKLYAATRTIHVAPWDKDVTPKPVFAVSDSSGYLARRLALSAFRQFGPREKAMIENKSQIQTEAAVIAVISEAQGHSAPGALTIDRTGALLVYTVASRKLGITLAEKARVRGVPCINVLEPVLTSMERRFGLARDAHTGGELDGAKEKGPTVFAVSDEDGSTAHDVITAALYQFPNAGVDTVTVCDNVRSLEEINHIVEKALHDESMIVFTLASPGMARYMRQQCERSKVPYADVLQPIVLAMEEYLKYPPVGVPGGYDLKALSPNLDWRRRPVVRIREDSDV